MNIILNNFSDYYHLKKQIESEFVDGANSKLSKSFLELPKLEQQSRLKERLKKYCQKVYTSLYLIKIFSQVTPNILNLDFFDRHIDE